MSIFSTDPSTPGGNGPIILLAGGVGIGALAGALIFKNHRVAGGVGGAVAGIGALMLISKIQQAQSQAAVAAGDAQTLPSANFAPTMPPSNVATLTPGSKYIVMAELPPGVTTADLPGRLQTAGWSNITELDARNAKDPSDPNVQAYQFMGVWSGAANAPVPNNVSITSAP